MTRSFWTVLAAGAALLLICSTAYTAVQVYRLQPHATLTGVTASR